MVVYYEPRQRRRTVEEATSDPWFWIGLSTLTFMAVLWWTNPSSQVARATPAVLG